MSIERAIKITKGSLYETDFALWLEEQLDALRRGDYDQLDRPNLVEEIEDLGKNLRREVASRLETLIVHLIKLSVSREDRPKAGWRSTVREQRRQLEKVFSDSPSLRRYADEVFMDSLSNAKSDAYAALVDHEPNMAKEYQEAISAGWDLLEMESVLDHGLFLEVAKVGGDRPT